MTKIYRVTHCLRRAGLAVLMAGLMVLASLVVLQLNVLARHHGGGAGGCFNFDQAVASAQNGDTIAQMIPEKDSFGVTISRNIILQGGWNLGTTSGCLDASVNKKVFTGAQTMLDLGFVLEAPQKRSTLYHDKGSVITIDPKVLSLTIQHMVFENRGMTTTVGGGISGVISNGAQVMLENVVLTNSKTVSNGGGLYLEVRGGSHLVVSGSQFFSNSSPMGGGFEIRVFDNSKVTIRDTQVLSNKSTAGNGGGGRIIIESGLVTVTNSTFSGNQTSGGNGADLSLESTGGGPALVWLLNSTIPNVNKTGSSLIVFDKQVFLPVVLKNSPPTGISNISLSGSTYVVEFWTTGFTPQPGQQHVHFFFNTVSPDQAGLPGTGPWRIHESASPFTGYTTANRPSGATEMCILVANPNHSVQPGTGNCFWLP